MTRPRRYRRSALLAPAAFLILPLSAPATPERDAPGFLVGCWEEGAESGLKEYFAPPARNMMTGLSQFWRDGRIVDWEFHRIDIGPDGPVLTPHPRGVASVSFQPIVVEAARIVWENRTHDFPNRIEYVRTAPDSLVASIEGGEGAAARRITWRMATCQAG